MSNYIPKAGDTCLFQGNDLEVLCVGDKMVFGVWLAQEIMVDKREVSRKKTPEEVEEEGVINAMMSHSNTTAGYRSVLEHFCGKLHKAGYHNQPKVKHLSCKNFINVASFGVGYKSAFEDLRDNGYIIEAKEKG